MSFSKVLGSFTKAALILAVLTFLFVLGFRHNTDLAAKRSFQRFLDQLELGQTIDQVEELAARTVMGVAEAPLVPYSREKDLCQPPDQWMPANLLGNLHEGPGGSVAEPCAKFVFYGFDGKERQALDVFYDGTTKRVIGWISYGKDPVGKQIK